MYVQPKREGEVTTIPPVWLDDLTARLRPDGRAHGILYTHLKLPVRERIRWDIDR